MTVELGYPGVSGYGYSSQGDVKETNTPSLAETDQASQPSPAEVDGKAEELPAENGDGGSEPLSGSHDVNGDGAGANAHPDDHAEVDEEVAKSPSYEVPGYEASAASSLERAGEIARSLNHTNLTTDHLMLALTLNPQGRRLLERVGDITQLREAAMQRLGHCGSARNSSEQSSTPTSDLADIAKAARDAASEREQSVAISDLINAFPKMNGRLTYGSGDGSQAMVLMAKIENGLVPRVTDSMTKIEAVVVDAMQQSQTVQKMLQDLNSKQTYEADQRQIAFMENIREQIREAVTAQVGVALKQFGEELIRKLDEVTQPDEPGVDGGEGPVEVEVAQPLLPPEQVDGGAPKLRSNPWGWLSLI